MDPGRDATASAASATPDPCLDGVATQEPLPRNVQQAAMSAPPAAASLATQPTAATAASPADAKLLNQGFHSDPACAPPAVDDRRAQEDQEAMDELEEMENEAAADGVFPTANEEEEEEEEPKAPLTAEEAVAQFPVVPDDLEEEEEEEEAEDEDEEEPNQEEIDARRNSFWMSVQRRNQLTEFNCDSLV